MFGIDTLPSYKSFPYTLIQMLLLAFLSVLFPTSPAYSASSQLPPIYALLLNETTSTDHETSYKNFKEIGLTPQNLNTWSNARAYADFSGDGRLDLFICHLTYWPPTTPEAATPSDLEFWIQQPDGTFRRNTDMFSTPLGCIHPRKALVADFNQDNRPDVFVAGHGFDAAPYPGERNKVILSQNDGTYLVQDASTDVGFFHSAVAADMNDDGYPDVIAVNSSDQNGAITLINQKDGTFTKEVGSRLPASIGGNGYFTIEIVDVNEDDIPDLLMGGHEWEGADVIVLINPGDYDFSNVTPTVLPAVPNEGVVLDFVVTGSGATRTIWVLRTSGGDGTFYESRVVQKVTWPGLVSTIPLNERPKQWVDWIIPTTVNGQSVIASDDSAKGLVIPQ